MEQGLTKAPQSAQTWEADTLKYIFQNTSKGIFKFSRQEETTQTNKSRKVVVTPTS